ncbi:MAG: YebC/PmpR family DNA-binding transcriptional regulator [Bacillota bacterium]
MAVLLEAMTDNLNRTVAEIRHIFSRHGGSLGESGCVAWMFSRKGFISADLSDTEFGEDELMMTALETGAEDIEKEDDGTYSITTEMESFEAVKNKLQEQDINIFYSELTMLPSTIVEVTNPDSVQQILSLIDALEDHDDVLNVYANYNIPDELLVKQ